MLCRNPYVKAGAAFPCGRCEPCLFNRKRLWTHRVMLESLCHSYSNFVTLTYSDEHLPRQEGIPVLVKEHLQLWLKRFRKAIEPMKVRFYGVGEYGSRSDRPHYHVVLFGYPQCVRGQTLVSHTRESRWAECCDTCRLIGTTWGFGDIFCGLVTKDSAQYVAKYTVKHMTHADDIRLVGRPPEFCRMSLRPGIGADAMWDVASDLISYGLDQSLVDVPTALAHGRSKLPLGRYLKMKLRERIGRDVKAPQAVLDEMAAEMRPLREAAFNASSSFAKAIVDDSAQRVLNIEARNAVYKKGDKL